MTLPVITSRNSVQISVQGIVFSGRITTATNPLYTCPANTIARIVEGRAFVDTLSGDATYAIAIQIDTTWVRVGASVPQNGMSTCQNIKMEAGDDLAYIGDNGDLSATIDMYATIIESPA